MVFAFPDTILVLVITRSPANIRYYITFHSPILTLWFQQHSYIQKLYNQHTPKEILDYNASLRAADHDPVHRPLLPLHERA